MIAPAETPAVILGQVAWEGNPSTKKNRPMIINLVQDGDGKNRKLSNFLADLKTTAESERERLYRFLEMLYEAAKDGLRGEIMRDIEDHLAHRGVRSRLLKDLDAACSDGGLITHVLPSEDYRDAQKIVVPQLHAAWQLNKGRPIGGPEELLHLEAFFYLGPRQRPDLLSLKEACSDLLQEAGVITDDRWIESWDGSRRLKHQRHAPRTEVTIYRFTPPGDEQICLDLDLQSK